MDDLPRQARDKHKRKENSTNNRVLCCAHSALQAALQEAMLGYYQVRKRYYFLHRFYSTSYEYDHFAKTGSGQT